MGTVKSRMRQIEKVWARVHLGEQGNDLAYWRAQPYQVRLMALEQIRQEYHRWRYGAEPGLQRVLAIVKR